MWTYKRTAIPTPRLIETTALLKSVYENTFLNNPLQQQKQPSKGLCMDMKTCIAGLWLGLSVVGCFDILVAAIVRIRRQWQF